MSPSAAIVWFRNDLRLHDHPALAAAVDSGLPVVPLYVVDPRALGPGSLGSPRCGPFRTRFLIESLAELRRRTDALGTPLVVRRGPPEEVVAALAREFGAPRVFAQDESTDEEQRIARRLRRALDAQGATLELLPTQTLFHRDDLPFPVDLLPTVFTDFRKAVEARATIRAEAAEPTALRGLAPGSGPDPGPLPTLADLGHAEAAAEPDPRAPFRFVGGESAGLARLAHYLHGSDAVRRYKETRNGLLGADDSSRLSPWLALGCLSPRRVAAELRRYTAERGGNDSTYWLMFELLWRDFFRFVAAQHGARLFRPEGPRGVERPWERDRALFESWCRGETGVPFVDAALRELRATGWMPNRVRQVVASFLARDLALDWTWGAAWFEGALVDYDAASNWGNWAYVAGVGNDPRENRAFSPVRQARAYDPEGRYIRRWLPELERLPDPFVFEPALMTSLEQEAFGVRLGQDYPRPVAAPRAARDPEAPPPRQS